MIWQIFVWVHKVFSLSRDLSVCISDAGAGRRQSPQVGCSRHFVALRIAGSRVVFCPVNVRISSGGPCGIAIALAIGYLLRANGDNPCLHDVRQRLVLRRIKPLHHLHLFMHVTSWAASPPYCWETNGPQAGRGASRHARVADISAFTNFRKDWL